ncbi:hypothetical protein ABFC53_16475 [Stenotrophomonas pavanii]|uniref:hypothetical protein n=1 Tax=Stenotrophomonas maltophilia group TaxID=995085 RepID=UPI0021C740DD|nr:MULTISPECIES: hypothetical protein [Stenotrophomonas]MCU1069317.1 hypothetical protein [Stenotrophomonas maltophilia]MCU1074154.1 hypothetical protein [Stenotrophomonas maltophilia]MCU1137991.1 hypothetical protein [Stenotrophomonas maltophilia]MDT3456831.1 hypothetical protein [Stenotrophomonas pavanii]MDT3464716.1 hypothetical protein [Stenotrophomonas pavanii]
MTAAPDARPREPAREACMRVTTSVILAIAVLLQAGCARTPEPAAAAEGCDDPQAHAWYLLPPPATKHGGDLPPFIDFTGSARTIYDARLRDLDGLPEPSFRCGSVPAQAYRFVWDPAFFPGVLIRAQRNAAGHAWIVGRSARDFEISGSLPGSPATVIKGGTCAPPRALSAQEWNAIAAAFALLQGEDSSAGLDGSSWMFESVVDGEQRWFARWVPRDPAFRNTGRMMVELAGCTDTLQGME